MNDETYNNKAILLVRGEIQDISGTNTIQVENRSPLY